MTLRFLADQCISNQLMLALTDAERARHFGAEAEQLARRLTEERG